MNKTTEVISIWLVVNTETTLLLFSAVVLYNQYVTTQNSTVQDKMKWQVEACRWVEFPGAVIVGHPGRRMQPIP